MSDLKREKRLYCERCETVTWCELLATASDPVAYYTCSKCGNYA